MFSDSMLGEPWDIYGDGENLRQNVRPRRVDRSKTFQVMLNVKQFKSDEIEVKTVDNFVVIHCKHEEQADGHGFVSREFTRRYQLPDDVLLDKVRSSFSKDGILTIEAPRKEPPRKENERIVPITIQGLATYPEIKKLRDDNSRMRYYF